MGGEIHSTPDASSEHFKRAKPKYQNKNFQVFQ